MSSKAYNEAAVIIGSFRKKPTEGGLIDFVKTLANPIPRLDYGECLKLARESFIPISSVVEVFGDQSWTVVWDRSPNTLTNDELIRTLDSIGKLSEWSDYEVLFSRVVDIIDILIDRART
jgi:hypothetical protein